MDCFFLQMTENSLFQLMSPHHPELAFPFLYKHPMRSHLESSVREVVRGSREGEIIGKESNFFEGFF